MAHSWMTADSASSAAQQQGQGQLQNGSAHGSPGAASDVASAAAGNPGPAAATTQPQPAPARQQGKSTPAPGLEEAASEDSEASGEAEEEAARQQGQRDRLLRAALMGLVTGDLPVLTFAAGEPLMCRGQPGKRLGEGLHGAKRCAA